MLTQPSVESYCVDTRPRIEDLVAARSPWIIAEGRNTPSIGGERQSQQNRRMRGSSKPAAIIQRPPGSSCGQIQLTCAPSESNDTSNVRSLCKSICGLGRGRRPELREYPQECSEGPGFNIEYSIRCGRVAHCLSCSVFI